MRILKREFIYQAENRIINSCHASTLVKLPNDDILAAWFGGEHESADNVEIWSSRRHKGVWSTPVMLSKPTNTACWNPVLYASGNNVTLFFKRGDKIFRWRTYVRRSYDGGLTWDDETELEINDVGGRGPVKNKPIAMTNGELLAPASHEGEGGKDWYAFADISGDGGFSWKRSEYIKTEPYTKLIQPTLWESTPGNIHMLMRSDAGYIYRSDSSDYGHLWCDGYQTILPNNNSGIDLVKTDDNVVALVCNPVDLNWGKRSPLVVICSEDNGLNWGVPLVLAEGEGEYSYPAVIYSDTLHITFTWQRKTIMYCEVTI
ncbi:MAG: exo-alpha-sialidase [Eubacteriales bacterium]|jgi:predicted neuraminidase|nr:exo-alpha-sialidase [Eubacteriales bacterium]